MAWTTPKTNWVSTDFINFEDYNRIIDNLAYIKDLADKYYSIIGYVEQEDVADEYVLPFISLYNTVEQNLEELNEATYQFAIGDTKTFAINQPYIDYAELNRIESATLKIKNTLVAQKENIPTLSFTLGNYRGLRL